MTKIFSLPRGTSDILPDESILWQNIESSARKIFSNYGYREIRTPLFEETELFARSMGQSSEVVSKQMLNVSSSKQSDEESTSYSLRPENTASVVRSYIENNLDRQESISKFFYIGSMFRGERPQKGRLRQFHQMGAEAIGPNAHSPYLDVEMIALAVGILNSFGLNNFQLKINSLGTAQDKENFAQILRERIKPVLSQLDEEEQKRFDRNVFRILDSKNKKTKELIAGLNLTTDYLSEESRLYFSRVKESLDQMKVKYIEDQKLVRGLDYYTHTVFEISDSSLGAQDALGAGGRYGDLVSQLGGPAVSAVGFALGMERIILAMPEDKKKLSPSMDCFVIAFDEQSFLMAFKVLNVLRQNNISADISYRTSSIKSQMRLANKVNAKNVILIGEQELKEQKVSLKNMASGEQKQISINNNFDELINNLR